MIRWPWWVTCNAVRRGRRCDRGAWHRGQHRHVEWSAGRWGITYWWPR